MSFLAVVSGLLVVSSISLSAAAGDKDKDKEKDKDKDKDKGGASVTLSCVDSDGGNKPQVIGSATASINGQPFVTLKDTCPGQATALGEVQNRILAEAVCAGTGATHQNVECPGYPSTTGPLPGACIQSLEGARCSRCADYDVPGSPEHFTTCGGTCASLLSDRNNCGSCGHVCAPDFMCGAGQCVPVALSCKAWRDAGLSASGLYLVDPNGGDASDAFHVYCDMTTDGGGWTLVMRVRAGSNDHVEQNGALGDNPPLPTSGSVSKLSTAQFTALLGTPGQNIVKIAPDDAGFTTLYVVSYDDSDVWPSNLDCSYITSSAQPNERWVKTCYPTLADALSGTGGAVGNYGGGEHYFPESYSDAGENWLAKPIDQGGGMQMSPDFMRGDHMPLDGTVWVR